MITFLSFSFIFSIYLGFMAMNYYLYLNYYIFFSIKNFDGKVAFSLSILIL